MMLVLSLSSSLVRCLPVFSCNFFAFLVDIVEEVSRVIFGIGEHLRSVRNWRDFAIGECSELERCQIAGNPTVFSRPNLVAMVTNYQVIYPRWFWT